MIPLLPGEAAGALVRSHRTRDPFRLCERKGITVLFRDDFVQQKGSFHVILNQPFIFINANLSEQMQRMVCAHELGHAILHRAEAESRIALIEFELFDITDKLEYEANLFAASLLLDEEEVLSLLRDGADVVSVAAQMEVNVNLVLLLLHELQRKGIPLNLPAMPRRSFLATLKG